MNLCLFPFKKIGQFITGYTAHRNSQERVQSFKGIRVFFKYVLISLFLLWLAALNVDGEVVANPIHIKVGVTAGPHVEVMEFVKEQAKKEGLCLEIVEFNDFILPNIALAEGDLDVNSYQHEPFLEEQVKVRGYPLTSIAKTLLMPMGVYSMKYKALQDLPEKAKVGIPNDPTNGGRALLLLAAEGVITLKPNVGVAPTLLDIKDNPKKLKFIELEAPQLPRSLQDLDAACINTDWALLGGIDASSMVAQEGADSPYANVIVINSKNKDNYTFERFIAIYQSDETKDFVEKRFRGAILPAW